jgi:hypothetical protein
VKGGSHCNTKLLPLSSFHTASNGKDTIAKETTVTATCDPAVRRVPVTLPVSVKPDETFLVEKESKQSIPETSNADHM